ncbi:MAG: peptidoglycan-binding protein, partial [Nitrosomonas sp.]|nr:peptidoglycan-binding protein [Nitrosomonas sp.]
VTPAIMRKIQQALASAGFNPGPADGVSGAKTVAAIESFQKQNNIPTGKITKRTLRALGVDF